MGKKRTRGIPRRARKITAEKAEVRFPYEDECPKVMGVESDGEGGFVVTHRGTLYAELEFEEIDTSTFQEESSVAVPTTSKCVSDEGDIRDPICLACILQRGGEHYRYDKRGIPYKIRTPEEHLVKSRLEKRRMPNAKNKALS